MPKAMQRRAQQRDVTRMSGQDLALEMARDLMVLPKEERAKAVRFINVMSETIDRETQALAAN